MAITFIAIALKCEFFNCLNSVDTCLQRYTSLNSSGCEANTAPRPHQALLKQRRKPAGSYSRQPASFGDAAYVQICWSRGVVMALPNLSVQISFLPPFPSSTRLKINEPPSVWLPPRAFQYLSAMGLKRASSRCK